MNSEQNRNLPSFANRNLFELKLPNGLIETCVLSESHTLVGNQMLSETYLLSRVSSTTNTVVTTTSYDSDDDYLTTSYSRGKIVYNPHSRLIKDMEEEEDRYLINEDSRFSNTHSAASLTSQTVPILDEEYPVQFTNNCPIYDLTRAASTDSDFGKEFITQPRLSSLSLPMTNDHNSISEISDITNVDFVEDDSLPASSNSKTFHPISGGGGGVGGFATTTSNRSSSAPNLYNPNEFSEQQISAALEVIAHFKEGPSRWVMLFAQMQSGKTDTFLLVGCEMLRRNMINKVIVFSGNSETDLRDQLKSQIETDKSKFYIKYRNYLKISAGISVEEDIEDAIEQSIDRIEILWGQDLLKKRKHQDRKSLFIWEESHYAQNFTNRPKKFMEMVGISADGNIDASSGKYGLSVSATPFSEMVDNIRKNQQKPIVYLRPGEGYNSVQNILKNGQLRTFTDVNHGLATALEDAKYKSSEPKYAVIRCSCTNIKGIQKTLSKAGWIFVEYDSKTKDTIGETTWNSMDTKPRQNTAILIRGRCRMGKNLEKSHLAFVFEPVIDTKTDTALQGLLGRVCGYSKGSSDVMVWVSEKLDTSNELFKYTQTVQTVLNPNTQLIIPGKGTNLVVQNTNFRAKCPLLPIKLPDLDEDRPDLVAKYNKHKFVHKRYKELLREFVEDYNQDIPNIQYTTFITDVCRKCLDEHIDDNGIKYTVEVHDVCSKLLLTDKDRTKSPRADKSILKWIDLITSLEVNHITDETCNIRDTTIEDYIWTTRAKASQIMDNGETTKKQRPTNELEGYIVHLFVFTDNPKKMSKLHPLVESHRSNYSSSWGNIEPNTVFLWGVVDYPEESNQPAILPYTNNKEVFGHNLNLLKR